MIIIYTGLPGSGKSLMTAKVTLELLERNKKYYKKTGIIRKVVLNLRLSNVIYLKEARFVSYWSDPVELIKLRDVDIIFDEIATYFDSTQWASMPLEVKRWLQLHRHFGVDIYGTTQDFGMIDISMRRLVSELWVCTKLMGSRDKSATKPVIKRIWGVIRLMQVAPRSFTKDSTEYQYLTLFGEFMWLTKKLCDYYDTTQELEPGEYPPLRHYSRKCLTCGLDKVFHV